MKHATRLFALLALAAALHAGFLRAETLADVEKAIAAKYDKLKSVKYDVEIEYEYLGNTYAAKGTYELLRVGDKWKKRYEEKWPDVTAAQGQVNQIEAVKRRLMIEDGEYAYTIDERSGETTAEKNYIETFGESNIGARWFRRYSQTNDLVLFKDDTIDGHSAYVVEATSKKKDFAFRFYTDKETGVMLKCVTTCLNRSQMSYTTITKNIKLNVDIPAEHFVFTPPPGVKVKDRTAELDDK